MGLHTQQEKRKLSKRVSFTCMRIATTTTNVYSQMNEWIPLTLLLVKASHHQLWLFMKKNSKINLSNQELLLAAHHHYLQCILHSFLNVLYEIMILIWISQVCKKKFLYKLWKSSNFIKWATVIEFGIKIDTFLDIIYQRDLLFSKVNLFAPNIIFL